MGKADEIKIKVTAEGAKAQKVISGVDKKISSLGSDLAKLALAGVGAGGVVTAFKKISAELQEASEKAAIQEAAVTRLRAALEITGQAGGSALSEMKSFASEMQKLTVVGDETSLGLMQIALNMGLTSEQSQDATQKAIALSRAYGIDLNTAMVGVVNTIKGQTSTLTRYIPSLKAATDATDRMRILNEESSKAWAIATSEVNAAKGAQAQLDNALGDSKEITGQYINDVLTPWRQKLTEIVTGLNETRQAQYDLQAAQKASAEGTATTSEKILLIQDAIKKSQIDLNLARTMGDQAQVEYLENEIARLETVIARTEYLGTIEEAQAAATARQEKEKADAAAAIAQAEEDAAAAVQKRQDIANSAYSAIAEGLKTIAIKEEMALLTAEDYDAEVERRKLLLGEIAKLNEEGFSAESGAIQYILSLYGDLLEKKQDVAAAYESATEMMRIYQASAEQIAVSEAELEKARHDQKMANLQTELAYYSQYASNIGSMFSNLISVMMSGDEELSDKKKKQILALFYMQKAANIAQIGMDTATAVMRTYANLGGVKGAVMAGIVAAVGTTQLAVAAAAQPPVALAEGGIIKHKPGGIYANIGEGNYDEAVIPLKNNSSFGNTYNINLSGVVGDLESVAVAVHTGIERAKQSGAIAA